MILHYSWDSITSDERAFKCIGCNLKNTRQLKMEKIKERYEEMLEDKMKKHRHAKEEKWIEKRKRKN